VSHEPATALDIRPDDLEGEEIAALLNAHLANSFAQSPPESIHALDLDGLRVPGLTFWSAWQGGVLVGCGALKELDATHGEVKSMHTVATHRGRGVGARMVAHIVAEAKRRGYRRLSLETGSQAAYAPARAFYARFGFVPCRPFADCRDDPNSA